MVLYIGKIKTEVHPRALDNIQALHHDFRIVEQCHGGRRLKKNYSWVSIEDMYIHLDSESNPALALCLFQSMSPKWASWLVSLLVELPSFRSTIEHHSSNTQRIVSRD